ncbi:MAG: hypothetical protein V3S38_06885 [Acidimicrobiia bacterium]
MYGEAGRKLVMRVFRLVMLLAVVGVLLVFSNALPAHAWSRLAPPHISDISPGQPIPDHGGSAVVGVFEQEHIAESPWFIFIWLFGGIVAFTVFRRQGSRRV